MSPAMTTKQCKFSKFYCHYYVYWKWEMLYEKHMQWKDYSKALKLLKGCNTTLEYYSGLFDFFFFLFFKSWLQQQKSWKQITPSSLNQHLYYNFKNQEDQWLIFDLDKVDFDDVREILTFFKPFCSVKHIPAAYFEPSRTFGTKHFCDFLKEASP